MIHYTLIVIIATKQNALFADLKYGKSSAVFGIFVCAKSQLLFENSTIQRELSLFHVHRQFMIFVLNKEICERNIHTFSCCV